MAKRICVFGDSVTWGTGLARSESWVDLLRAYLVEKAPQPIEVYNLGIDGDASKDILIRIEGESGARNPDVIIIAVGTNDSIYRVGDKFDTGEAEFTENLKILLDKAKKFTEKLVLVGLVKGNDSETIPLKVSTTGKCYSKHVISKYDECIRKVADTYKVPFVDINSRLSDSDFDDGLHPNAQGHAKIFDTFKECIEKQGILDFLLA